MPRFTTVAELKAQNTQFIKAFRQAQKETGNLKKELGRTNRALKANERRMKEAADSAGGFTMAQGLLTAAISAGAAVLGGAAIVELGRYNKELQQVADQLGITSSAYKDYIALFAQGRVEIDDVRDGFTELAQVQRRLATDTELQEMMKEIGFAFRDANGQIKTGTRFINEFFDAVTSAKDAEAAIRALGEAGFDRAQATYILDAKGEYKTLRGSRRSSRKEDY